MAWAQPAFTRQQFAGTASALLRAYAKVLGDVDGDFNVNIIDFSAVAYADGSWPREAEME